MSLHFTKALSSSILKVAFPPIIIAIFYLPLILGKIMHKDLIIVLLANKVFETYIAMFKFVRHWYFF